MTIKDKRTLSSEQQAELLKALKSRFEKNMERHTNLERNEIQRKLESDAGKTWSLYEMERTEGEPDVTGFDRGTDEYIFCDCSAESPKGRRSSCYDREGQDEREKQGVFPQGNAVELAASMGIELLTEEEYFELQKLGNFDTKTSSWIRTPVEIRDLGGAIFGDRRYGRVFIYHNGAPSFYAARGFRGKLRV
jgi:hypothetical protein